MRAGHRGVFDDGHRRLVGAEHDVAVGAGFGQYPPCRSRPPWLAAASVGQNVPAPAKAKAAVAESVRRRVSVKVDSCILMANGAARMWQQRAVSPRSRFVSGPLVSGPALPGRILLGSVQRGALDRRAKPRQRLPQIVVLDLRHARGDARGRSGSADRIGRRGKPPERSLAQRDAFHRAPAEEAIDAFADDVRRGAGSRSRRDPRRAGRACPAAGRRLHRRGGHWILMGSLCAAISAPAISVQRVTNSAEAKPWRVNVSPTTLPSRSRKRLRQGAGGLVHGGKSAA